MRWQFVLTALLLCIVCALGACYTEIDNTNTPVETSLNVEKVEGLPDDFWLGADVSSVISLENSGVSFYDFDGKTQDLLKLLADNGVNVVRVRLWVDPFDQNGNGYGGGNCELSVAKKIAERAARYGLGVLVDFHYSDFWADPAKQQCPKAWSKLSFDDKRTALADYTAECLRGLLATGATVVGVQIGNEINGAMCGESSWDKICLLFESGAQVVRQLVPNAKIIAHFTDPHKEGKSAYFAQMLKKYSVDYDVFATSYYSFWHGTTQNLQSVLQQIKHDYGKDVMVAETSHPFTDKDSDFYGNNVSASECSYEVSPQGQATAFRQTVAAVNAAGGIGVFYWEPAWISVGGSSYAANLIKWQKYGSGWASSYAGSYSADAAQYYGGSSWDNQALFDSNGKPLESLKMFACVRKGTVAPQ